MKQGKWKQTAVGLLISSMGLLAAGSATSMEKAKLVDTDATGIPHLVMNTDLGKIVVKLNPNAGPETVSQLVDTLQASLAGSGPVSTEFDYTIPNVEIRAKKPDALKEFSVAKEINAKSLGLSDKKIDNVNDAMDTWQFKIFKYYTNTLKKQMPTEQLQAWMDKFEEDDYRADFLIGVSKTEVLEALGHTYVENVQSMPAVKGSVMLKPDSVSSSGGVISIALTDLKRRNGDWMVIGDVMEGLEIVQEISVRPSSERNKPRWIPFDPVEVSSVDVEWIEVVK